MHTPEIAIEGPSQGARRATGEGSQPGWKKPERFSARHKTEVVLRLLRGEALAKSFTKRLEFGSVRRVAEQQ